MAKKAEIINFHEIKKEKLLEREKTKKLLTDPKLYDEYLIESEIARLRSEFGLDKKEEKK